MSKLPPPPRPKPVNSNQLSKALGISKQLMNLHKKNPLAPEGFEVSEWRSFLAAVGREETADDDILRQISMRKLSILATKDETEKDNLRKSRGELIEFKLMVPFLQDIIGNNFSSELDRISQELPPNLVGLDAPQIFIEIRKEKDAIKRKITEKIAAWISAQKAKHKKNKP